MSTKDPVHMEYLVAVFTGLNREVNASSPHVIPTTTSVTHIPLTIMFNSGPRYTVKPQCIALQCVEAFCFRLDFG